MSKFIRGTVVSVGTGNTIVVRVDRKIPHPKYRKLMAKSKKLKADRGDISVEMGSLVSLIETRPLSRDKFFKVKEVIPQGGKK